MKNAAEIISQKLPEGWRARVLKPRGRAGSRLQITAPDGRRNEFVLIRKRSLAPREVITLFHADIVDRPSLVVAPYLSPAVRRRLTEAGVGYVDATGNIRLSLVDPGLFIEAVGADRDPNPNRRPSRSLAGAKAGQIVRALCKHKEAWGVREIAKATGANPGYVSRLLAKLDGEALVDRDKRGRVKRTDWQRLIQYWAESAPIDSRGLSSYCIAPRGLSVAMSALKETSQPYSVTGSFATDRFVSVAPARLLHLYVESIEGFRRDLKLTETDIGANVVLIEPKDASIFSDSVTDEEGMRWAPPVQVAADLLTSPGRGPAEGEALLVWMAEHEEAWRE
ncbi:MAG: helix-turn-helix domain-containing protein [Deltaproteobacteria bacterium]|nr:helix-turn-helix domain-containing protein [Deltaproteobacteria bacterium]